MGVSDITHVPQTPPHVKGVINLRGKTMRAKEYTHRKAHNIAQDEAASVISGCPARRFVRERWTSLLPLDRIATA